MMMLRKIILKRGRKKNGKLRMAANLRQQDGLKCDLTETDVKRKPKVTLPMRFLCT